MVRRGFRSSVDVLQFVRSFVFHCKTFFIVWLKKLGSCLILSVETLEGVHLDLLEGIEGARGLTRNWTAGF